MKLKILIATRNRGKLAELERLLSVYIDGAELTLLTLDDVGFTGEIVENGATFAENAMIKAKTAADMANVRAYYAKLQADYMLTGEYDPSVPSESSYPREITYPDGTVVKLQAGWIAATVVEKNGVKLGYQVAYLCERGDCTLMLGANGSPGG